MSCKNVLVSVSLGMIRFSPGFVLRSRNSANGREGAATRSERHPSLLMISDARFALNISPDETTVSSRAANAISDRFADRSANILSEYLSIWSSISELLKECW